MITPPSLVTYFHPCCRLNKNCYHLSIVIVLALCVGLCNFSIAAASDANSCPDASAEFEEICYDTYRYTLADCGLATEAFLRYCRDLDPCYLESEMRSLLAARCEPLPTDPEGQAICLLIAGEIFRFSILCTFSKATEVIR